MSQNLLAVDASLPSGDTGSSLATKLNNWRATLLSLHSGSSRPTYAAAGMTWRDTSSSPWVIRMFDGAADVPLYEVDPTTHLITKLYGPVSTTALAGLMSAADKTKLDGIEAGATANADDADLLARANHTGSQAISTITGLQEALDAVGNTGAFGFTIDGGGAVIAVGTQVVIPALPFDITFAEIDMLADVTGSIQFDVWADTYANFPPTIADTITASSKPAIAAAQKAQKTTFPGWANGGVIAAGSPMIWNVDSVASIKKVTVGVTFTK